MFASTCLWETIDVFLGVVQLLLHFITKTGRSKEGIIEEINAIPVLCKHEIISLASLHGLVVGHLRSNFNQYTDFNRLASIIVNDIATTEVHNPVSKGEVISGCIKFFSMQIKVGICSIQIIIVVVFKKVLHICISK